MLLKQNIVVCIHQEYFLAVLKLQKHGFFLNLIDVICLFVFVRQWLAYLGFPPTPLNFELEVRAELQTGPASTYQRRSCYFHTRFQSQPGQLF